MAVTQNTYTGDGSTVLFSFTFPYLETTDIKVSLNGTDTNAYTLANATTVQFTTAPANGVAIRIYRQTDDTDLTATFYPGSAIRSQDLNDNFTQNLYVTQESSNNATTAINTANSAVTTANSAVNTANSAVSTANSAVTTANNAVTTANTASTNASTAVSTANSAVTTANSAEATAISAANDAATAVSTANDAATDAATAISTANSAATDAATAVSTANTASTNATAAVNTANTASTNATTAVNTANTASTNASNAVTTANTAITTANSAASAVANALLYTIVANVAAIPTSPTNNQAIEVTNSTGIQSFTPLSGVPASFVGSSGLSVRIVYSSASSSWVWIQYFPNDPDSRYAGPNTAVGSAASPSIAFGPTDTNTGIYSPGADQVAISTNGTGRLFVGASGNVGVATSSPALPLDVVGRTVLGALSPRVDESYDVQIQSAGNAELKLQSGASSTSYLAFGTTSDSLTTGFAVANTDGALRIRTGNAERLRITSDGKLGVGTAAPSTLLHLSSATGSATPTPTEVRIATTTNADDWSLTDPWGRISFFSADTGAGGPKIHAAIDAVSSGTTGNSSSLSFKFTAAGSNTLTERFKIDVRGTATHTCQATYPSAIFANDSTELARIDSFGRLLVGTSTARTVASLTPSLQLEGTGGSGATLCAIRNSAAITPSFLVLGKSRGTANGDSTIVQSGDTLGEIRFAGADGVDLNSIAASISAQVDGTPGTDDMPGRIVLSTTPSGSASPVERMRISSAGTIFLNTTNDATDANVAGVVATSSGALIARRDGGSALFLNRYTSDGNIVTIYRSGTAVGSISVTTTATAYNTSSDYRLKENVVPLTGAVDRLNQLQVHRFNFIADPSKTVDGFLAHEAQAVVPECVTGTKDEVDEDGNPVYQGIDQSKLVPLLTAALQEALAEIESLKARVTALEP